MKILNEDFLMGICFFVSSKSNDDPKEAALLSFGEKIIFSDYSKKNILGNRMGSSINEFDFGVNYQSLDLYLNFTPSFYDLSTIINKSNSHFERIIYFKTKEFDEESLLLLKEKVISFSIIEYKGNLNWIRDFVSSLNIF